MDNLFALFKNSYLLPLVLILGIGGAVVWKSDFSVFDFLADRVIERIDARYSPYGPPPPTQTMPQQAQPQQPLPSQPFPNGN